MTHRQFWHILACSLATALVLALIGCEKSAKAPSPKAPSSPAQPAKTYSPTQVTITVSDASRQPVATHSLGPDEITLASLPDTLQQDVRQAQLPCYIKIVVGLEGHNPTSIPMPGEKQPADLDVVSSEQMVYAYVIRKSGDQECTLAADAEDGLAYGTGRITPDGGVPSGLIDVVLSRPKGDIGKWKRNPPPTGPSVRLPDPESR